MVCYRKVFIHVHQGFQFLSGHLNSWYLICIRLTHNSFIIKMYRSTKVGVNILKGKMNLIDLNQLIKQGWESSYLSFAWSYEHAWCGSIWE